MNNITSFGQTDIGHFRSNNEDAFVARSDLGFCLVADGMGGAAAGEVASQIFCETALALFSNVTQSTESSISQLLLDIFAKANSRILDHIKDYPEHRGMGCTAELIAFADNQYIIGHVGDSRTYRMKNGKLEQLSRDHSLVQEQLDKGIITPEDVKNHSQRNIILRAVGVAENTEVDLLRGPTSPGDLFLLCSDGLTDMMEDSAIEDALATSDPIPQKVTRLITLAKDAGGHDNITVVLATTD
ncbi:MAG: Stp1/IreP family PP2C-type Ser/Thr phosphatase [Deltaproteobacteria bacterium]|nr:Stp1/IreP family PP2C-type Ser/Thr phosphatase [Deltaproteobacteria bacterium]